MKVFRLLVFTSLIMILMFSSGAQVYSSNTQALVGVFFEAETFGVMSPLTLESVGNKILLREGLPHNITFYAYGYKPVKVNYTPSANDTINIMLEPSPLFTIDVIAPNYPDLPMGIYKIVDKYEDILGVTSLNGKGYFYGPFNAGDTVEIHVMPPHDIDFWRKLLNASSYEGYLKNVKDRFLTYEYAVPLVPAPLVKGVDTDFGKHTFSGRDTENRTVLMGTSKVLDGYVYTSSGEPLKNAIVAIRPERFYRYVFTFTDENGYYRFDNYVGSGKYFITVIYYGYLHPRQTLFIFALDRTFNITVPDLVLLEGYYRDRNGIPLDDTLLVFMNGGRLSIAYTDANGYYKVAIPLSGGNYIVSQKWRGNWLSDIFLTESDILDGYEDLTADVELVRVSGQVVDVVTQDFLGRPILRFTGLGVDFPGNITIDVELDSSGEFSLLIPKAMKIMGQYMNISWKVLMADYYYSGNLMVDNLLLTGDTNLGTLNITPPSNLVEVNINVSVTSQPRETPLDIYLFNLWYYDKLFNITIETNATFASHTPGAFILDGGIGYLNINMLVPMEMEGVFRISIPKDFMSGAFAVMINDAPASYNIVNETSEYTTLEIILGEGMNRISITSSQVISEFNAIYLIILIISGFIVYHLRRYGLRA